MIRLTLLISLVFFCFSSRSIPIEIKSSKPRDVFTVDVDRYATVGDLKTKLSDLTLHSPEKMVILLDGSVQDDDEPLGRAFRDQTAEVILQRDNLADTYKSYKTNLKNHALAEADAALNAALKNPSLDRANMRRIIRWKKELFDRNIDHKDFHGALSIFDSVINNPSTPQDIKKAVDQDWRKELQDAGQKIFFGLDH